MSLHALVKAIHVRQAGSILSSVLRRFAANGLFGVADPGKTSGKLTNVIWFSLQQITDFINATQYRFFMRSTQANNDIYRVIFMLLVKRVCNSRYFLFCGKSVQRSFCLFKVFDSSSRQLEPTLVSCYWSAPFVCFSLAGLVLSAVVGFEWEVKDAMN